jgi:hypothetical protein
MFEGNVFQKMDLGQQDLSKIDTKNPSEIANATYSPTFYTQLKDDPVKKAEAIATLEADPTTANLSLAGIIEVKASSAGGVADQLAKQLPLLADSGASGPDMGAVLGAILPPSIVVQPGPTPPEFASIIASFTAASISFTTVSSQIVGGDTLPSIGDLSSKDVAYYGLASVAVAAVGIDPTYASNNSGATVADAIWAAVNGDTTAITLDQTVFAIDDPTSTVSVLLNAAGIDLTKLMGTTTTTIPN